MQSGYFTIQKAEMDVWMSVIGHVAIRPNIQILFSQFFTVSL